MDGLLLAAYVRRFLCAWRAGAVCRSCVELGSGSGGVSLALALDVPGLNCLGLELDERLVAAARQNARMLHLEQTARFLRCDLATGCPGQERFDIALANPPYDLSAACRPSANTIRDRAMRQPDDPMPLFCRAAASMLRHHGHFFCVFRASGLPRLLRALDRSGLGIRQLLPVHPFEDEPASRVLARAQKDAAHDPALLPPLVLHGGQRGAARNGAAWSAQALAFCPRLGRKA